MKFHYMHQTFRDTIWTDKIQDIYFELERADQAVMWQGEPAATPKVPGSNPG